MPRLPPLPTHRRCCCAVLFSFPAGSWATTPAVCLSNATRVIVVARAHGMDMQASIVLDFGRAGVGGVDVGFIRYAER